ncbi:MAG TPA: hypothetical protein VIV11_22260 [Kofleriaceae bacterium]
MPDGITVPDGPELVVINQSDLNSIDVHMGDVYWTTDPFTGKGQVQKVTPGGQPQTLAAQEDHPVSIDVGPGFIDDTAFWALNSLLGQVRQIATSGAPPLSAVNANDNVYCLTLDGNRVFVGTRGAVMSKDLTNTSTLTTLASGFGNGVLAIDADATGVVFGARTTSGAWIVASVPRTGGSVTTLYTGTTLIRDLTIVGSNVVWLEANRIMRVARSGGTAAMVALVADNRPWAVKSVDGKLFVATNQGVINPTGSTGTILEIDPITGTKKELAKDQAEPADIAVDANYIYWANRGLGAGTGQILRLKR